MAMQYVMGGLAFAVEAINMTQFFSEEGAQVGGLGLGAAIASNRLVTAWNILHGPCQANRQSLFEMWVVYGWLAPPVWMAFAHYYLGLTSYYAFFRGYIRHLAEGWDNSENFSKNQTQYEKCRRKMMTATQKGDSLASITGNMHKDEDCSKYIEDYTKRYGASGMQGFWNDLGSYHSSMDTREEIIIKEHFQRLITGNEEIASPLYKGMTSKSTKTGTTTYQLSKAVNKLWHRMCIPQKRAYANLPGGTKMNGWQIFFDRFYDPAYNLKDNLILPAYGFKQFGTDEISEEKSMEIKKNSHINKLTDKAVLIGSIKFDSSASGIDPVALIETETGLIYILKDIKGELRLVLTANNTKISDYLIGKDFKEGDIIPTVYFPIHERTTQLVNQGLYQPLIEFTHQTNNLHIRYPPGFEGGARAYWKEYTPEKEITIEMTRTQDQKNTGTFYPNQKGILSISATQEDGERELTITNKINKKITLPPQTPNETCTNEYININTLIPEQEEETWWY